MGELFVTGLSHRAAPVEVRERLAFGPERAQVILKRLNEAESRGEASLQASGRDELALLSTCNRSEVYVYSERPTAAVGRIRSFLADHARLDAGELDHLLYWHEGEEAARHLLLVAAGLDSLVVGENEILGQVKEAYEIAQRAGTAGPVLSALFRFAARAGKRARSETEINRGGQSVASVVVELAKEHLGPLAERKALLVGAGKIGSAAARSLVKAGLRCIWVANRTYERAQKLAEALAGQQAGQSAAAVHFDALEQNLAEADIVICSTGAPHFVLHPVAVEAAMRARAGRPLLITDLAVPRDVDPAVALIPNVLLTDIDDLDSLVQRLHPPAAAARRAAEAIVREELEAFLMWLADRANAPLIRSLQAKANSICQAQVEQTLRRMGELSPEQKRSVEAMSAAIASKLLHDPIAFLHESRSDGSQPEVEELFGRIFGLERGAGSGD